jgi:origin recognition complex subunit 5
VVVYGSPATGKSGIANAYLQASELRHVVVNCRECVTGRHLLEKTVAAVHESLRKDAVNGDYDEYNGRCENLSSLVGHLLRLLRGGGKYILAFDGIDRQREAPPTLLPALARLGEVVCLSSCNGLLKRLTCCRYPT